MKRLIFRTAAPMFAAAAIALAGCGFPPATLADTPPGCVPDRATCILEAVHALEAASVQAHWTKSGKPRVSALETVAGFDVSAAERDAAWAAYPEWKAERQVLDDLREALAGVTAERDRLVGDVESLSDRVADRDAALERAHRDTRTAEREAAAATDRASKADTRAAQAEEKARALSTGVPVCTAERAIVRTDDSWLASGLREKVTALLACLDVGDR